MITFPETLDTAERLAELLKSSSNIETALEDAAKDLADFLTVLEYMHTKEFSDTEDVLNFVDNVLIPQVLGIRDSLQAGTDTHQKRLKMAHDQAERLVIRLRVLVNDGIDGFLR
jgi:hypothetical protein